MLRSKSLFQVIGYLLKFEILRYLKKYGVGPYAGLWGQNRSTGISRRPEFPAYEKKGFFKISQNLKLQIIKVLNCKVCIKKLAIFSNENFYSIMQNREKWGNSGRGVIPVKKT